jgi:hypothetical protein
VVTENCLKAKYISAFSGSRTIGAIGEYRLPWIADPMTALPIPDRPGQRLGAAIFVALLVTGQMLSSVLFDHYGLFGVAQRPAGVSRLLGSVLLIVSVILIRR